ncbi:RAxF-45 family protein [Rummeliibacillus sp. JY-2-4R]
MKNSAMKTGVNLDTAMYFARVITFDFANNGISMSFFQCKSNKKHVAD